MLRVRKGRVFCKRARRAWIEKMRGNGDESVGSWMLVFSHVIVGKKLSFCPGLAGQGNCKENMFRLRAVLIVDEISVAEWLFLIVRGVLMCE